MKHSLLIAMALCGCLLASGCFRTNYVGLVAPGDEPEVVREAPAPRQPTSSWQNFFLFGWIPSEKQIDAAQACGGAAHIERIHTEQTFVQGLVTALSSFYINIYAPWTGRVDCAELTPPDAEPPVAD